jgi:hypothetical protein
MNTKAEEADIRALWDDLDSVLWINVGALLYLFLSYFSQI